MLFIQVSSFFSPRGLLFIGVHSKSIKDVERPQVFGDVHSGYIALV